jgi:hypothetical protein
MLTGRESNNTANLSGRKPAWIAGSSPAVTTGGATCPGLVITRSGSFILPREAGKGDRAQGGGRGVGLTARSTAAGPLHHPSGGPPPPIRFTTRGRMFIRHCEEQRDEAIQLPAQALDCFAAARNDA